MFITLHFKTINSHIDNIIIIKDTHSHDIGPFKKRIQKHIADGKLAVVRAIFEMTNYNDEIEYHIFDFTGKSFIIIDTNKDKRKAVELKNWVVKLEERLEMSGTNGPRIYTVKKQRTYASIPDRTELSFHELMLNKMNTELASYFKHFKRVH